MFNLDSVDELTNSLNNLYNYFNKSHELDCSGSSEYDAGISDGMIHASEKLKEIMDKFEKENENG